MAKMKVSGSKIADVGELLAELKTELENKDSFDLTDAYDKGMHDELAWLYRRLTCLPDVPVVTSGQAIYEGMR